jgi:release factor glutamine methyltransferase
MAAPDAATPRITVREALQRAQDLLQGSSREPKRDAVLLLSHAMGRSSAWLIAHSEDVLPDETRESYDTSLRRRLEHEPVQYIVGEHEFYGLTFHVTRDVLIPRPETEHLVEAALDRLPRDRELRIADIGTGSGAIAVALATHLPHAQLDAIDLSAEALAVAQGNAEAHGVLSRIAFLQSDLLANAGDRIYDCIVSNPPYIPASEVLEPQVAHWEPHAALFAGEDGLAMYRRLIPASRLHLRSGGLLALEIGYGQRSALAGLFHADAQWHAPEFLPDLQGIARVALAQLRG